MRAERVDPFALVVVCGRALEEAIGLKKRRSGSDRPSTRVFPTAAVDDSLLAAAVQCTPPWGAPSSNP
jgi:hypothetical protein